MQPDEVIDGFKHFGVDDRFDSSHCNASACLTHGSLYSLLNVFEIKPWDTWIIRPGIVHAPGAH